MGEEMIVTVGGMMVASGVIVEAITVVGTVFVLFASGMSDSPDTKMDWAPTFIGVLIGAALIAVGKYSGL